MGYGCNVCPLHESEKHAPLPYTGTAGEQRESEKGGSVYRWGSIPSQLTPNELDKVAGDMLCTRCTLLVSASSREVNVAILAWPLVLCVDIQSLPSTDVGVSR
jgi:hypothetical protein